MDKISIVIPVYKVEKYLDQCLDSIINQTYKNLEIILVDDGSPDNCPQICDEWAKKDGRIVVLHKNNEGVSRAVMDGIKISTGKYLSFLDSDDYVESEFLEKLYTALLQEKADISVCNYTEVYEDKKIEKRQIKEKTVIIKNENIDNCAMALSGWNNVILPPCRWNKLFKRELILNSLKYVSPEISMGEDTNMTFYAMSMSDKIALIPECLHYYRQIPTSLSKIKRNNWVHYKKLLKQLIIINNEEKLNLKSHIYKWLVSYYINECVCYVVKNCNKKQIKEFLNDEDLQYFVNTMPIDNFKKRVYYWGLKHKNIFLVKLAAKLIK